VASRERWDLSDPEEDQVNEENEGTTGLWERRESGEVKGIWAFQDFPVPLVTLVRRATGVRSGWTDQREIRDPRALKERRETEEIWAMKVNRERKDRRARRERREAKDPRVAEDSRGKRASRDRRDPAACRATWGYRACRGHRDQRGNHRQIRTSNKSA